MIEVKGDDVYRAGVKIGWISGSHIYDRQGKQVGYFTNDSVYDANGTRMAHIADDYVYDVGGRQIELEQIIGNVAAVGLSDGGRVALVTLLGM